MTPARCAAPSASAILRGERHELRQRQAVLGDDAEIVAVDVLHHHVRAAVVEHVELGHGGDVLVHDAAGDARLAGEALVHARIVAMIGVEDLEGDVPSERLVLGEKDLAHAA